MTERTASDHQSFDDYWAERQRKRGVRTKTERILGIDVIVPTHLTRAFKNQLAALQESGADEHAVELVGELFGPETYERWLDAGVDDEQLVVILGWGIANAAGTPLTFAEADEMLERRGSEDGQGNASAANRQQRRAAQSKPSASTGGQSKRTSGGSTGSRRRR